jgi:hypothetical protein
MSTVTSGDTGALRKQGFIFLLYASLGVALLNVGSPTFVGAIEKCEGFCGNCIGVAPSCIAPPTTLPIWAFVLVNPILTAVLLVVSVAVAAGGFYISRRTQNERVATIAKGAELVPILIVVLIGLVALGAYPPYSVAHPLF